MWRQWMRAHGVEGQDEVAQRVAGVRAAPTREEVMDCRASSREELQRTNGRSPPNAREALDGLSHHTYGSTRGAIELHRTLLGWARGWRYSGRRLLSWRGDGVHKGG